MTFNYFARILDNDKKDSTISNYRAANKQEAEAKMKADIAEHNAIKGNEKDQLTFVKCERVYGRF